MRRVAAATLACVAVCSGGLVPYASAQTSTAVQSDAPFETQLAAIGEALSKAKTDQAEAFAPASYARARQLFDGLSKEGARNRNPNKLRNDLNEARTAVNDVYKAIATARSTLVNAIQAREDALRAQAPKFGGEEWIKAATRFDDAARRLERGDVTNAQRRAAESEVLLREVELIAIKGGLLNEVRALLTKADQDKVAERAPRTLQAAKRLLNEAEQEITRNRYDLSMPRSLVESARYEARHAMYLSELIANILKREKDDQFALEETLLGLEDPLKRLGSELDISPRFETGYARAIQDIAEQANKREQELGRLTRELADRNEQLTALNTEVQRLEARLGGVSQERVTLQRRVDAQEMLRGNVAKVEGMFAPDEARVSRQGEDVIISLLGINFPPGRSTIDAGNMPLLGKVQQSLALFPGSSLVIEGHTDANGSDSANLILSQDRADAVKQYIVSNFAVDPEKISSIGYGESRPVATNETQDGRSRNRRIDVVIRIGQTRP
jgi:outer membrane protein OmpA-like peptidoglycan-associated protein